MPRLVVPDELNRNSERAKAQGAERTGLALLDLVTRKLAMQDLAGVDVLDVGCGVRFTQTIVNEEVPIGSYTGIDVSRPVVEFLTANVTDPRFAFAHWDVHNAMYNPASTRRMRRGGELPVRGDYDVIWLFSVFTHLNPEDSDALLEMLRRYLRPSGRLFFTAFVRPSVERFEDKDPANPLRLAAYGEPYLREIVESNGWEILTTDPPDHDRIVQHQFLCKHATLPASASKLAPSEVSR